MKQNSIAVRFDKNAVAFFDRATGTKLRFALGSYIKASKPELVDIKLTDFCSFGCDFCYMGSTLQGKHGTVENIDFVVKELKKAKVFEVAMGGGEPTESPHFVHAVKSFAEAGIVPNFTTKFPGKVRKLWSEIGHLVGGFAYSAENAAQVKSASKLFSMGKIPKSKINLHYVMGLGDRDHFREYLEAANEENLRVTLLGYKTTGRGKEVIPYPYDWWIEEITLLIERGVCPSISIDTPLAGQYENKIPIPAYQFHTHEGAYSMYIDLVEMKMGASSFEEKTELVPFTKAWRKVYRKKTFSKPGYAG